MVSLIALPIPTFPYISDIVHIVHIVLRIVESDCGFENILAKRFLVAFKAKPHRQSHLLCRTRLSRVVFRPLQEMDFGLPNIRNIHILYP